MADRNVREQDVVEYILFPVIPDGLDPIKQADYAKELHVNYIGTLSKYLVEYMWQSEPFKLKVVQKSGDVPCHLYGSTHYGDNVDDEWFIVWMLFRLTKAFPGLIARIHDIDGEFLLIEAADSLEKWVKPESAEKRVYIHDGNLHIIPHPQKPSYIGILPSGTPSPIEAVECIRKHTSITKANARTQKDIQRKLNDFPESCNKAIHHAHCYLPAAAVAVLNHSPGLVASAIQAFYYRGPIDIKACRTMNHFRPGTRVMSRVKFTRCLYAQLLQQKFSPERRSDWSLPSLSKPHFKSYDLGMKLAYGFEILYNQSSGKKQGEAQTDKISEQDVRWNRYLKSLKDRGYFRDEIEGSKLYTELLNKAKLYFIETLHTEVGYGLQEAGSKVKKLLETLKYDIEDLRRQEQCLPPPDDEEWLTITPDQLDAMLAKASGKTFSDKSGDKDFNLSQVSEGMKTFVEKVSSLEGAEFPREDEDIHFDSGGFMQSIQKLLNDEDHHSDSSSGMSEYSDDDIDGAEYKTGDKAKKSMNEMDEYMEMMDHELAKTKIGQTYERQEANKDKETANGKDSDNDDIDDLDDDFKPVDVDLTVVKNLLESYSSQDGKPGPASNILTGMGIHVPDNTNPK